VINKLANQTRHMVEVILDILVKRAMRTDLCVKIKMLRDSCGIKGIPNGFACRIASSMRAAGMWRKFRLTAAGE
jgi:hypothetical protein